MKLIVDVLELIDFSEFHESSLNSRSVLLLVYFSIHASKLDTCCQILPLSLSKLSGNVAYNTYLYMYIYTI